VPESTRCIEVVKPAAKPTWTIGAGVLFCAATLLVYSMPFRNGRQCCIEGVPGPNLIPDISRSVGVDRLLDASLTACHPERHDGPWADRIPIGTLPLELGQTMELEYEFGDGWEFTVKLVRVEPPGSKIKPSRILESHGEAPEQYPDADW